MVFSADNDSHNSFEIDINTTPPPAPPSKSDGLNGGVVAAIVLGSVAAGLGAIGGITYYFLSKSGLQLGAARTIGEDCPCDIITLDDTFLEKLRLDKNQHTYLIKTLEINNMQTSSALKYLVADDTTIKNQTFDRVYFELPKENTGANKNIKIKLIQASKPYLINNKLPELDTKILIETKGQDTVEIPLTSEKIDNLDGILIKRGNIISNKEIKKDAKMALVTSYNSNVKNAPVQTYAVLVEFE